MPGDSCQLVFDALIQPPEITDQIYQASRSDMLIQAPDHLLQCLGNAVTMTFLMLHEAVEKGQYRWPAVARFQFLAALRGKHLPTHAVAMMLRGPGQ